MGLSPDEFYSMRLSHFFLKMQGFYKRIENEQRARAELVRMQTVYLVNVQLKREDRFKSPAELWQLPWDNTEVATVASESQNPEDLKQLLNLLTKKE